MHEDNPSAVSEAMPRAALYAVPQRVEYPPSLRQKLERRSPAALSTTELVALILRSRDAKRGAQGLLQRHGLARVAKLTFDDLRDSPGIGPAGAARLAAALELHRRFSREQSSERPKLTRPREVYHEVRDICRARKEHLIGLYLDAQNQLLHRETLSIGSLNTTRTHPREIMHPAIQHLALGFILAHNHPSGSLEPSPEDLEFTRSVQRAGELMGIELYDHVIVSVSGHMSLREMGQL